MKAKVSARAIAVRTAGKAVVPRLLANKYSGMLLFAIIDIDFSQFSRPGGQFPRQRRRGGSRLSVRFDQRSMSWNRQNVIYWTRIKQNFG